jgi:hypothetical protein
VTRGVDGSSAAEHEGGATIYPCFTATDADEANYAVAQTVGQVQAAGDLLVGSAANTLTRVAKGGNSTVFQVSSGGAVQYGKVTSAMLDADVVTFPFTTVTKQSDESVSSSNTLQADDELLFTALNGVAYEIECWIVYAAPAGGGTPDIHFAFGEDETARGVGSYIRFNTMADTAGGGNILLSTAAAAVEAGTATSKRVFILRGGYVGGGGTFNVMWAQDVSGTDPVTVYAGSFLRYRALTA